MRAIINLGIFQLNSAKVQILHILQYFVRFGIPKYSKEFLAIENYKLPIKSHEIAMENHILAIENHELVIGNH